MARHGGADVAASGKALRIKRPATPSLSHAPKGALASGVEIECDVREIEHPEGRFVRPDGTRYDICVMEVKCDPTLRPPALSRANFAGERADTELGVVRLGNVKSVSFRPQLVSPAPGLARES